LVYTVIGDISTSSGNGAVLAGTDVPATQRPSNRAGCRDQAMRIGSWPGSCWFGTPLKTTVPTIGRPS
jgi:hypothetical protein